MGLELSEFPVSVSSLGGFCGTLQLQDKLQAADWHSNHFFLGVLYKVVTI